MLRSDAAGRGGTGRQTSGSRPLQLRRRAGEEMRRQFLVSLGLLLVAAPLAAAAGTRMLLVAHDLEDHPLSGFRFAYEGVESEATNRTGATELDLPAEHRPGETIRIFLLVTGPKRPEDWFLV